MDRTTRIDTVITLPPKDRVNLGLAALAGALAVLVVLAAHDRFLGGSAHATFAPSPAPPTLTAAPSEAHTAAPPRAKGKGHD